jgi:hypothetical protein
MGQDLVVEMSRAVKEMLRSGVEHHDVRLPDVLWNPKELESYQLSGYSSQDAESLLEETGS